MEDPKASLDYRLTKLEEHRRQLGRSLIEASAAKRRLENQRNQMAAAVARYTEQATASVEVERAIWPAQPCSASKKRRRVRPNWKPTSRTWTAR